MREFPHPNLKDFECPVCKTSKDLPVVLVEINGTRRGNIAEGQQIHSKCYRLLCEMLDMPCDIEPAPKPQIDVKEALRAACRQLIKDHESKAVGKMHSNHVCAARLALAATIFHPDLEELREATKNLADDHEFGATGDVRKVHLAQAHAAMVAC